MNIAAERILRFLSNKRHLFFISVVFFFFICFIIAGTNFSSIVKASFGVWGDTSLIHACINPRGLPTIVSAGTSCNGGETQTTWVKDVDAGTGLSISRSSSGVTLSLANTNTDGWTSDSSTWVYDSANTFKITGSDKTNIFTQGTRIKCTNNGQTYYGTVEYSEFSTDTVVTLIPNSDFSLNNSTISSPFYSYQLSPAGYPGYFKFVPSVTGFSSTTALEAEYYVTGNMITVDYGIQGTSNASNFIVSTPAGANVSNVEAQFGIARARDNGNLLANGAEWVYDDQNLRLYKDFAETGWTASGFKSAFFTVSYRYN